MFASYPNAFRHVTSLSAVALAMGFSSVSLQAQEDDPLQQLIEGLELRAIGPAMMGGRIADIEVNPDDPDTWYVAVGSGGLWKTINAGITWAPVFDDQRSYSIGEVTLDPANPEVVWAGTGENVSGRHVGWGDGVYRSADGGTTWTSMGLEKSEHIGRILVDPSDSRHILVAAEGPLWSSGGERGVYRSTDGGATWTQVLSVDDDTGATDLEFHPDDPSVVYAATYERRRTVWSFLAGGKGSGIWKSEDGGATWREITQGLPTADEELEVGKIGLAVTPADPDRVYATIEANDGKQGFFVSLDRGESWERRNEYISGGTGPHYYQEIEASPADADRVYQMDVFMHVTPDAGKTFSILETGRDKHSDNHALWIDPDNPRHLLAGTDGGLYESFDDGQRWRHFPNLPISQFYKVALSNHEPFYNVLLGAQDLGTLHGPSRTTTEEGVRNQDWYVPYGADGYGVAFDPFDPDIFYQMSQVGNLVRHHKESGENVYIRPRPAPGAEPERWNWDSPIEVSVHQPGRIYFGSQRLWQSDDRGNSWSPISSDLTRGGNRFTLPVNGRVRSTDALWDLNAMSGYATLTAVSESALQAGRLWTGSDDGRVQRSTNGGKNWEEVTPAALPERAFVNDVEASQHNPNGAFVVADNHKTGDYRPLLFATDDGGRRWRDIRGDLPDGVITWAIQQDHVEPGLLFLAAENGLYVTLNGGQQWHRLSAGVPTIAFRDLKLQRRDADLVGATFGRGVYILDDYTPLREMAAQLRETRELADATLFPVRDAWWYIPSRPGQAKGLPSQGSDFFRTPNPEHGPLFTIHMRSAAQSPAELRREGERKLARGGADIPFPGWDELQAETVAPQTRFFLEIRDAQGVPVRRLSVENTAGTQRIHWDMRGTPPDRISFPDGGFVPPWMGDPEGPLVAPGEYTAQLYRAVDGTVESITGTQAFSLKALDTLDAASTYAESAAFQAAAVTAMRRLSAIEGSLSEIEEQTRYLRAAIDASASADAALHERLNGVQREVAQVREVLRGNAARGRLNEYRVHAVASRIYSASASLATRLAPTATQVEDLRVANGDLDEIERRIDDLRAGPIAAVQAALRAAGAPWTPGQRLH